MNRYPRNAVWQGILPDNLSPSATISSAIAGHLYVPNGYYFDARQICHGCTRTGTCNWNSSARGLTFQARLLDRAAKYILDLILDLHLFSALSLLAPELRPLVGVAD